MMYLLGAAAVASVFLGALCVFTGKSCTEYKRASMLGRVLATISACGVIGSVAVCSVFYISAAGSTSNDAAKDAFSLFVGIDIAAVLICLAVTIFSSFTSRKMMTVRHLFAPLWAIVTLMWTALCLIWSSYDGLDASIYIGICGIFLSMVLCAPASIDVLRLARLLSTKDGIAERKAEIYHRGDRRRSHRKIRDKRKKVSAKRRQHHI